MQYKWKKNRVGRKVGQVEWLLGGPVAVWLTRGWIEPVKPKAPPKPKSLVQPPAHKAMTKPKAKTK